MCVREMLSFFAAEQSLCAAIFTSVSHTESIIVITDACVKHFIMVAGKSDGPKKKINTGEQNRNMTGRIKNHREIMSVNMCPNR